MTGSLIGISSNGWVAIATVGLMAATIQLYRASRNQVIATSLTNQGKLLGELDTDFLRRMRQRHAEINPANLLSRDELIELLAPIEHVATAIRRKGLDLRSVWASSFGDVIYFHIDESLEEIQEMRSKNPTLYEDLLWYRRKATRLIQRRNVFARISGLLHQRSNNRRSKYRQLIEDTRAVETKLEIEG